MKKTYLKSIVISVFIFPACTLAPVGASQSKSEYRTRNIEIENS